MARAAAYTFWSPNFDHRPAEKRLFLFRVSSEIVSAGVKLFHVLMRIQMQQLVD